MDDFAFTGRGDQITAVLVQNGRIYVPSAAYVNQDTPNLLTATLVAE